VAQIALVNNKIAIMAKKITVLLRNIYFLRLFYNFQQTFKAQEDIFRQ
jgi:hypothetical protein